jgi:hypothetical protein
MTSRAGVSRPRGHICGLESGYVDGALVALTAALGELLKELTLDPTSNYQPQ